METNLIWQGDMAFEAEVDGFKIVLDAAPAVGGKDLGPRPKGLTLVSLSGCTAMDVISILKKMQALPTYFAIQCRAVIAPDHPKKIDEIELNYIFRGDDISPDKVKKAITLSQEKYCGVSATLKPGVKITTVITINDQIIP